MIKKTMYKEIKKLQHKGYSKSKISKVLDIDRKTVFKYWSMSEQDYQRYLNNLSCRFKEYDQYKEEILQIYYCNNFKKLQISALFDYLEEKYQKLPATEKSLRNYIRYLTETNQLVINTNLRMYKKVPELPFGRQLQIDFGIYKMPSGLILYIFAAVLSASRYKYIAFQDKPFKTECLIKHLLDCFDYIEGIPKELVIDQDSIMVVNENHGDIIFTKDFSVFKEEMGLKIYTCRKADPESKGKIENVIKFVKNNFLSIRDFTSLEDAKDCLAQWLIRRANGKISQATKMIPMDTFKNEKKHLNPLRNSIFRKDSFLMREDRIVNDKSFISFNGSQYSVPDTYRNKTVEVYSVDNYLYVFNKYSGEQIAKHNILLIPGKKSIQRDHFRQKTKKTAELKQEVLNLFNESQWQNFSQINFKTFPRYSRDQCLLAKKYFSDSIEMNILEHALDFCLENKTYSFKMLYDTYLHFTKTNPSYKNHSTELPPIPIKIKCNPPLVSQRDLNIYLDLLKNNKKEAAHECI